jgi:RimJ/RimL family protein N-acetyltransferase
MNAQNFPVVVDNVLFRKDAEVAAFVMANLPQAHMRAFDNPLSALGVIRNGQLVGGIVFHTYYPGINIEISIYMNSAKWATPRTLARLYSYPFLQLNVPRITAVTSRKNKRTRRFLEGVGWKLEGTIRKAFDGKYDAMIYGQLREECKWLDYLKDE